LADAFSRKCSVLLTSNLEVPTEVRIDGVCVSSLLCEMGLLTSLENVSLLDQEPFDPAETALWIAAE
jgi:hypothetical protein